MVRKRVLVVDDHDGIRRAIVRSIRAVAPTSDVETAVDAQEALNTLLIGSSDSWFVMTDWDTGDPHTHEVKSGPELIRRIRDHRPQIKCFFLLMSGGRTPQEAMPLLDAIGCDVYMEKPVNFERLLQCLRAFMAD